MIIKEATALRGAAIGGSVLGLGNAARQAYKDRGKGMSRKERLLSAGKAGAKGGAVGAGVGGAVGYAHARGKRSGGGKGSNVDPKQTDSKPKLKIRPDSRLPGDRMFADGHYAKHMDNGLISETSRDFGPGPYGGYQTGPGKASFLSHIAEQRNPSGEHSYSQKERDGAHKFVRNYKRMNLHLKK